MAKALFSFVALMVVCWPILAQEARPADAFSFPDTLIKKRLTGVVAVEAVTYATTMYGLYALWYKDYPQSHFHFFDDNAEWQQMDKVGHAMTAYEIGRFGITALRWTGLERKKAVWYGGLLGFTYQSTIEAFDGFSKHWGASTGDVAANAAGTSILIGQELLWKEQRVYMKFSTHLTGFAQYRPGTFGSTIPERIFKDYNGQSYWLTGNIYAYLPKESKFPKWLSIAVGYGATGMTGGTYNPLYNSDNDPIPAFVRRRQYFLSLDVDLSRIPTKSRALHTFFDVVNFIKIPAPAIEWNRVHGLRGHWIYY